MRRLLLYLAALTLAAPAYAQTCTTEWSSPVSGAWSVWANWTNGVPQAGDVACITAPGTYTVRLDTSIVYPIAGLVVGGSSGRQTLISGAQSAVALTLTGDSRIGPNGRMEIHNGSIANIDGLYVDGTLLVDGEIVAVNPSAFFRDGGVLDVAPGGVLRYETPSGGNIGNAAATFRVRGVLETDCGNPCNVDAFMDVRGGTLRAGGRVDFSGNGVVHDLALDVPAGSEILFRRGTGEAPHYVIEGTVSGTPSGNVQWAGVDVAAGSSGATLAVGGTGFQLVGSAFLVSAGGAFVNTGVLLRAPAVSNFAGVRAVTVRNEGVLPIPTGLSLLDGAVLRNEAGGVIDITAGGSIDGDGQLENAGLILRTGEAGSFTFAQGMLRSLPGSEIRVETSRLDLRAPGAETLPAGATLSGSGRVFVPAALEVEGTVSPGSDAQPLATLEIESFYYVSTEGSPRLVIDVAEGGQSDRVDVLFAPGTNERARLNGALIVRVAPGYVPQVGDEFTILQTAGQITGAFDEIVAEGAPDGIAFVAEVVGDATQSLVLRAVVAVGIEGTDAPPREVTLAPLSPNPTRGEATFRWSLPAAGRVSIRVYDLLGREVARPAADQGAAAGHHETPWASGLPSGVYVALLQAEIGQEVISQAQRFVVVR